MLNLSLHPTSPGPSLSLLWVSTGRLGTPQVLPKAPSLRGGGDGEALASPCPQLCFPFPAPVGAQVPAASTLTSPARVLGQTAPLPDAALCQSRMEPPSTLGMWQLLFWHRSCSTRSHAPGDALASGWVHPTSCPFPLGATSPCREYCVLWGSSLSPRLSKAGQGQTRNLGHPWALAWGGSCTPQVVPSPMSLLSSSPPVLGLSLPFRPGHGQADARIAPRI